MTDIAPSFFFNVLIFLLVPFLSAYILRMMYIPPLIGYIIGGILAGNLVNDLIQTEVINHFAYFGIVLLMFTIGLEVNFEKIIILKKFILVGGLLQILLSILLIAIMSTVFGFTILQSLVIGIALASSSTALVAKIVQDRGEESSFLGELTLGILMLQDLAFIPFIILFTFLNTTTNSFPEIGRNILVGLFEAITILLSIYYTGKKIVPFLFHHAAKSSRELLNLFLVIFIFFISYFSSVFGVPILIGVFIAGILISQTSEHYQIFSQVRPIRDVLAIIFFVFIGSHIQLSTLLISLPTVVIFSLLIMITKALLILIIFICLKFSSRLAFSMSLLLFQVSETSFILLSIANTNNVITHDQYLFLISSVIVSLIVTPLMIKKKEVLYYAIRNFFKTYIPSVEIFIKNRLDFTPSSLDSIEIKNHVVICGYGRVGSQVGRGLMLANIPFIAIDYNFYTVQKAKKEGVQIIYGDPTDIDILDYAQTDTATALISVVPEKFSQEAIILNAKKLNPRILVISRVHNQQYLQRMKDLGVDIVIQPELEASISIIKKIFFIKKLPKEEMLNKIKHFKLEQGIT